MTDTIAPSILDENLTPEDWGTTSPAYTPSLADLPWTEDLFSFVERAVEHAGEVLDLGVLPRDWQANAFQTASDFLIWTNSIYGYAPSFHRIIHFVEVAEVRRWWRANQGTPTSLSDPDFASVGGTVQAAVHMVITNIYLAAIRHESARRTDED